MSNNAQQNEGDVKIRRARCDSLCIYEITESEIELLERGSPNSIYLNFSIFLFSIAIPFIVTLLTINIDSIELFLIFLTIAILGILIGSFLLIFWFRARNSLKGVIKKIKDRLPPDKSTVGKEPQEME